MANTSFNDNLQQNPLSNSAQNNAAAKDDTVTLSSTGGFALDQILDNDPGSAIYQDLPLVVTGGTGSVEYDEDSQTFQVYGDVTSFEYVIRLANGTYSKATVTLNDQVGPSAADLLFEETFSGYTSTLGWETINLATNLWTGQTTVEIIHDGYEGLYGPDPDAYWLDTQASPGGIDISHEVMDANAGQALISFTAAYQQFDAWTVTGALEFLWNGVVVKSISTADFTAANQFLDFSVVVDSLINNTLEIRHTGVPSNVGFALDSVTVNDWIIV